MTPAQRDALDELERRAFGRDGGWVPVTTISRQADLDDLVELGLAERQPAADDNERPDLSCRKIHHVPFIVVLPREAER